MKIYKTHRDRKLCENWAIRLTISALVCALALASPAFADEVIPTLAWNDFYSASSTFNGEAIPVGSRVEAFDPSGVLCGRFTITEAGKYGFMPVYGDDSRTGDIDEGAVVGDLIEFRVNGIGADVSGPIDWISAPANPRELNLSASGTVALSILNLPGDKFAAPFDTVDFQIEFQNTGTATDFYTLALSSLLGWEIIADSSPLYVAGGLGPQIVSFSVIVPGDISGDISDQISFDFRSGLDPALGASGSVMILVISTGVDDDDPALPHSFALKQNYPNPFNPQTKIPFALDLRSSVTITIFDILGRQVDRFELGTLSAGAHEIDYAPKGLSSGVYFYRLKAGSQVAVKRMTLLK